MSYKTKAARAVEALTRAWTGAAPPPQRRAAGTGTTVVTCKRTGCDKTKRVFLSDIERGWGLYCSQRCKALQQAEDTGRVGKQTIDFASAMRNKHGAGWWF